MWAAKGNASVSERCWINRKVRTRAATTYMPFQLMFSELAWSLSGGQVSQLLAVHLKQFFEKL